MARQGSEDDADRTSPASGSTLAHKIEQEAMVLARDARADGIYVTPETEFRLLQLARDALELRARVLIVRPDRQDLAHELLRSSYEFAGQAGAIAGLRAVRPGRRTVFLKQYFPRKYRHQLLAGLSQRTRRVRAALGRPQRELVPVLGGLDPEEGIIEQRAPIAIVTALDQLEGRRDVSGSTGYVQMLDDISKSVRDVRPGQSYDRSIVSGSDPREITHHTDHLRVDLPLIADVVEHQRPGDGMGAGLFAATVDVSYIGGVVGIYEKARVTDIVSFDPVARSLPEYRRKLISATRAARRAATLLHELEPAA